MLLLSALIVLALAAMSSCASDDADPTTVALETPIRARPPPSPSAAPTSTVQRERCPVDRLLNRGVEYEYDESRVSFDDARIKYCGPLVVDE